MLIKKIGRVDVVFDDFKNCVVVSLVKKFNLGGQLGVGCKVQKVRPNETLIYKCKHYVQTTGGSWTTNADLTIRRQFTSRKMR